jgi:hypothetical protein
MRFHLLTTAGAFGIGDLHVLPSEQNRRRQKDPSLMNPKNADVSVSTSVETPSVSLSLAHSKIRHTGVRFPIPPVAISECSGFLDSINTAKSLQSLAAGNYSDASNPL